MPQQKQQVDYVEQVKKALEELFEHVSKSDDDEYNHSILDIMRGYDPNYSWMVNSCLEDISKTMENEIVDPVTMKDIYETFKPTDDFQGTVYLTDGVWVNPDGSMTSN
jgi:hypothetical protein